MSESVIRVPQAEIDRQNGFAEEFRSLADRPKKYFIVTYGCQMNAHDSEKLAGMMDIMGMEMASSREDADFVLHNTCCIRDNAERKALGNVTWLKELRKQKPSLLIGVCGCMVQQPGMAEKILRQYPFIDIAFGTGNVYQLPELLLRAAQNRKRVVVVPENESTLAENLPVRRDDPYQAYVTIMYGCNNYCSYCIVPYVRGRERSRMADDILREIDMLQKKGIQEIMLLGQNVNSYGNDMDHAISFAKLLKRVSDTGIPRIRFMTSHPKDLSDELIDVMATTPSIMKHFHLPVQSGSNEILKAMNRRYTREKYLERLDALRSAMPDIGVTTDIIVAFPGETEQDFNDTMDLVHTARYDSAFTFIYSPRVGTQAAKMPNFIAPDVATERIEKLIALQEKMTAKAFDSMMGETVNVLVTGNSRRDITQMTGKCERNISVNFAGSPSDLGKIIPVKITSASKTTLRGEKLEVK